MKKKNEKKRVSEKKKKEKKEKKKRGYIKKGSKKGSESEPASSTHIKGCLVCTPSSCGITLQQKKHFTTWLHPTLLLRACKALP